MKFKILSVLVMMSTLMCIGCGQKESGPEYGKIVDNGDGTFTIIDMQERNVTFRKDANDKVICLGAGALRYYSYIGDVKDLIAVENIDKEPFKVGLALRPYYQANKEFFATLPICGQGGPQGQSPETELIRSLSPNIIVSFYSDPAVNNKLQSDLNIPVVALKQGADGLFDNITLKSFEVLGKVFEKEERANELINYVNNAKADLKKLTIAEGTYYAGGVGNWGQVNLFGSQYNFPIFSYAGVNNAVHALKEYAGIQQITIDAEKLISINPDRIFIDTAGLPNFIKQYKENPTVFDALKAFKNKETYILLPFNAYYTNLEIQLMSTYYVASVSHPNEFANFALEAKFRDISQKFLGKDIYDQMKAHPYGYGGYQKIDISTLINE